MENIANIKKHWLILLATCGMAGSALGLNMNVIGVFYQPVAQDLNILVGTFAFHSTLSAIAFAFIALFIPRFLDIIHVKKMILFGVLIASLSSIGMAFTSSVWIFNILGILRGFGCGLFGPITFTTLINNWFDEKNSLALSIAVSFAGIIGMIMSPIFTWTIEAFGWRTSFIIMGLAMAVFNLPAVLTSFELHPKNEDLLPYGAKANVENSKRPAPKRKPSSLSKRKKVSYFSLPFLSISIIALLHTYATGIVQNFPGFANSLQFSSAVGASMLSAAMLGNIGFKVFLGLIGEKMGIIFNVLVSLSLTILGLLVSILIRQPYILIASSFIFGAAYYIPAIGLPLLTNYFFGKQTSNRIYPFIAFLSGVGGAVSMSLVGFVFDFTGSYLPAFWLSVIFSVICIFLLIISVQKKKKAAA